MALVLPKFPRRRSSEAGRDRAEPIISLRFDRADACYLPGERLEASWLVKRGVPERLQGLEASVLWFTEGKGDEDLAVHFFQRLTTYQLRELDLRAPQRLRTTLPASPLSYEGRLLRIRWCVRLRVFLSAGREVVIERPLHLGPRAAAEA